MLPIGPPHNNTDESEISLLREEEIGVRDSRVIDDDAASSTSRSVKCRSFVLHRALFPAAACPNINRYYYVLIGILNDRSSLR